MKDIRQNELTGIPVVVVRCDGAWRPYPEVETIVVPDVMNLLLQIGATMIRSAKNIAERSDINTCGSAQQ